MPKQPEKNIDQLFRMGSEQYDFEYNTEAWKQMEELLNEDNKRRRFIWWFWGIASGVVLLSLILSFWNSNPVTPSNHISTSETSSFNVPQHNSPKDTNTEQSIADSTPTSENDKQPNTPLEDNISSLLIWPKDDLIITSKNRKPKDTVSKQQVSRQQKNKTPLPLSFKQNASATADDVGQEVPEEKQMNSFSTNPSLKSDLTKKRKSLPLNINALNWPNSIVYFNNDFTKNALALKLLNVLKNKSGQQEISLTTPVFNKNQLLLTLQIGGEVNMAEFKNASTLHLKWGGQIEYRFLEKYSASIGVNFIRKAYKAPKGTYSPPPGFWVNATPPQSTSASCDILEIPLLMGFFPNSYKQSGFFANAGLTSYFMLREQYNYFYDSPDPELVQQWKGKNKNRHWFGIGQADLGYQKQFSKKFSMQLSAYLQFPLTGVGHGKVKLWSAGIQLKNNFRIK